jgi:hypothetical protein
MQNVNGEIYWIVTTWNTEEADEGTLLLKYIVDK